VADSMFTTFDHRTPPIGPDGTPFQYYEALRDEAVANGAIGWSEEHNGFWVVAGYPECHEIMQNHDGFSSAAVTFPAYQTGERNTLMLAGMDEPVHKKYRSLVVTPFSPRQANDTEGELRKMTNELIDAFIADGATDVAKSLCYEVPGRLTALSLGLPQGDGDRYRRWTDAMAHLFTTDPAGAAAIVGEMHGYFETAIAERKQNLGEDVLSLVIQSELDGEKLTDEELMGFCIVLLLGGIENSVKMLSTALWRLAWDVELRRRIIAKPEMMNTAVDEFLRYYTPAGVGRVVLEDTEVAGVKMRKDEIAFLMLPTANRDPRQFPYPDVLIPERSPNRHLTLGTGIHRCIGTHLLRVEGRVVLTEFLRRLPEYELDREQKSVWATGQVTGMIEVPIVFPAGMPRND
jgi:cytochrome P450